jgi:ABC-2 type transport system ATP-binding protein
MTGRQVLRYVSRFFGHPDEKQIDELLERTGIADAADRKTKTYSGGMNQRLGIAQALIGRPKLLILDEPASALDPVGRAEVLTLMRELRGETTIFFSTHILEDVQRCSDYVAILDKGRLLTASSTKDLLASFTKNRLHVVLTGSVDVALLEAIPGVTEVSFSGQDHDKWIYNVTTKEGSARDVQRAVTKYAADRGLAVLGCDEIRLNLESVFLKLIAAEKE